MGWSAEAGSGYQNQQGSQQQNNVGSYSKQGQSTWVPNPAMTNNYGQANAQLDFLQQTPVGYFPGYTTAGPSAPTQAAVGAAMGQGFPMAQEGAANIYGNAGVSQQGYGDAMDILYGAAGMAPGVAAAYGGAAGMAPGVSNAFNTAAGAYGQGAGAQAALLPGANENFQFLSNAADLSNNPYVEQQADAMTRRLNQNFSENLLPGINAGANQVNALGSSRHALAQAQGAERTQEQLSRGLADLYSNAYQTGIGAQTSALGQTGAMLNNQLAPANALSQGAQQNLQGMQAMGQGANYLNQGMGAMGQGGQYLQQGAQGLQQGAADYAQNVANAQNVLGTGIQGAYGAGDVVQQAQQNALNDEINAFNAQYEEPWTRLNNSANLINGLFSALGTNYTSGMGNETKAGTGRSAQSGYNLQDKMTVGGKKGTG